MGHETGPGPDPCRGTGNGMAVETGAEPSEESRFDGDHAMPSPARSPRDSRNIAVALALLAFAVVMFLVTIVKFEEQLHRIGMPQTRGETAPPRLRTSGAAAFFPISDALAWGSGTNLTRFGDSNGLVADSDRGNDHVDHGDVDGGVAVARTLAARNNPSGTSMRTLPGGHRRDVLPKVLDNDP